MRATTRLFVTLGALAGAVSLSLVPTLPAGAHPIDARPAPYSTPHFLEVKHPPDQVVIAPGDTLAGVAVTVGRTWQQLAGWNHLDWNRAQLVLPGQVVNVPPASYTPPDLAPPPAQNPPPAPRPVANTGAGPGPVAYSSAGGWSQPWACIAEGESGGNPAENTGNGYEGGLQFSPSTWTSNAPKVGVNVAHAYQASIGQQEAVAAYVLARSSWQAQWPATSKACGYW